MHLPSASLPVVLLAGSKLISAQATRTYQPAPVPSDYTFYGNASFQELGQTGYHDSEHFRVYNTTSENAAAAMVPLEGAWDCFVNVLRWRDSGLSTFNTYQVGPWWKSNIFTTRTPGVLGYASYDWRTGLGYSVMDPSYVTEPSVLVHEYGHILSSSYKDFWRSSMAMGWAEPIANFASELYRTSSICAASRAKVNDPAGWTLFTPDVIIPYSHLPLIDAGRGAARNNEYFAWPWLTYLTQNPDDYPNLGRDTMKKIFSRYNATAAETPFHTLQRIVGRKGAVQRIAAKYWARMSYIDFGDAQWYTQYAYRSARISYDNLDLVETGMYRVKEGLRPRYLGASIIPLVVNGTSAKTIRVTGSMPFSATVAILGADKEGEPSVRYRIVPVKEVGQPLVKQITFSLRKGEDATLTVVNTPNVLVKYDARLTSTGDVAKGLDYRVEFVGAVGPRGRSWLTVDD